MIALHSVSVPFVLYAMNLVVCDEPGTCTENDRLYRVQVAKRKPLTILFTRNWNRFRKRFERGSLIGCVRRVRSPIRLISEPG